VNAQAVRPCDVVDFAGSGMCELPANIRLRLHLHM
jgi:hypothetical protein